MQENTNDLDRICVIYFEGKEGEIKNLTQDTLNKIIQRREQWLLHRSPKSLLSIFTRKQSQEEPIKVNDVAEHYCYHSTCYRNFTDTSKLERAKNTLKNAERERSGVTCRDEHQEKQTPAKLPRSTRQSFGHERVTSSFRSSNVLPEFCLICKQNGPVFITDKVMLLLSK